MRKVFILTILAAIFAVSSCKVCKNVTTTATATADASVANGTVSAKATANVSITTVVKKTPKNKGSENGKTTTTTESPETTTSEKPETSMTDSSNTSMEPSDKSTEVSETTTEVVTTPYSASQKTTKMMKQITTKKTKPTTTSTPITETTVTEDTITENTAPENEETPTEAPTTAVTTEEATTTMTEDTTSPAETENSTSGSEMTPTECTTAEDIAEKNEPTATEATTAETTTKDAETTLTETTMIDSTTNQAETTTEAVTTESTSSPDTSMTTTEVVTTTVPSSTTQKIPNKMKKTTTKKAEPTTTNTLSTETTEVTTPQAATTEITTEEDQTTSTEAATAETTTNEDESTSAETTTAGTTNEETETTPAETTTDEMTTEEAGATPAETTTDEMTTEEVETTSAEITTEETTDAEAKTTPTETTMAEMTTAEPETTTNCTDEEPIQRFTAVQVEFTAKSLLEVMRENDDAPTLFFSPLSALLFLLTLIPSTEKHTYSGLLKATDMKSTDQARCTATNISAVLLNNSENSISNNVIIANASVIFTERFKNDVETLFIGETGNADYNNPIKTINKINNIIQTGTNGKITTVVTSTHIIDEKTSLIVAMGYYYRPILLGFDTNKLVSGPFYPNGKHESVEKEYFVETTVCQYTDSRQLRAQVAVCDLGDLFSIMLICPSSSHGVHSTLHKLSKYEIFNETLSSLKEYKIDLRIPYLGIINTTVDFKKPIDHNLHSADRIFVKHADFVDIVRDDSNQYVSEIIQKAQYEPQYVKGSPQNIDDSLPSAEVNCDSPHIFYILYDQLIIGAGLFKG